VGATEKPNNFDLFVIMHQVISFYALISVLDSSKMVPCDPNDEYVDGDICESIIKVDKTKGRWHLKEYNGVPNSQFVITTTVKADEGNYTCQASNIAGNLRETAQVTIGEKGNYINRRGIDAKTTLVIPL
jgi:hypothetical protein